jgi:hypothetical protein
MSVYLITYTKLDIKQKRRPFKVFNNLETCYEYIKNYFNITTDEHLLDINLIKTELRIKKYSLLYYKFPDFMLEIYKMNITENIETEEL